MYRYNCEEFVKKLRSSSREANLLKTTVGIAAIIIFSKLLGFGREALIAGYYGVTAETDAFFFAQNMPAMIFPAVCTSVSTAFISLYVKRMTEKGTEEGDRYASRMLLATSILGAILSVVGVLLAPILVPLLAPGFSRAQLTLAIYLTRLSMGAFLLCMLQYMLGAILNAKKLFVGSQLAALLYNVVVIGITVLLGPGQSMQILTLTVIAAAFGQILALVGCCRGNFHCSLRINPFHEDTRQLLRLSLPILLGNSVVQLNTIVDKALGSMLPQGSLSALSYANTLNALVISVFVVSLSTILYPALTTDAAKGDMKRYASTLQNSLSGLSLLLLPISCITFLTARDIVEIVYARGNFDESAVTYTAVALAGYAPMFVASGIREVLTRGFFAIQDTKTPMRNSAIGVGFNIVFSLIFVRWLGIAGIALGTTLSTFVTATLLLLSAHHRLQALPLNQFLHCFGKQVIAGAVMVAALLVFRQAVVLPYAILRFVADTLLGFCIYFATLFLLRYPKWKKS